MSVCAGWPCLWVLACRTIEKKRKSKFFYHWPIFYLNSKPRSDSSLSKVLILQTTGSPQGTGFPSTSGQNFGIFGAALWGALRGWGKLFETTFLWFQSIRNYWPEQLQSIRNYWLELFRSVTSFFIVWNFPGISFSGTHFSPLRLKIRGLTFYIESF